MESDSSFSEAAIGLLVTSGGTIDDPALSCCCGGIIVSRVESGSSGSAAESSRNRVMSASEISDESMSHGPSVEARAGAAAGTYMYVITTSTEAVAATVGHVAIVPAVVPLRIDNGETLALKMALDEKASGVGDQKNRPR